MTIFVKKKYFNFISVASNFFLYLFKNLTVVKFMAIGYKKGETTNLWSPSFFVPVVGSGDPGWKKIRIRDPQH